MTTSWVPEEDEDETPPVTLTAPEQELSSDTPVITILDGPTWDNTPVPERVQRAVSLGISGRYGSKTWDDLTLEEKAALSGKLGATKLEYQVKTNVALEDSDKEVWGIAKDTDGDFDYNWKPGEGVIVGTWTRSPVDGLIRVYLEPSIKALHDKATQSFYDHAERRREAAKAPTKKTKTPRTPRQPKAPVEPEKDETQETVDRLRNLLSR